MNVRFKNCSNPVSKARNSKLITSTIQSIAKDSFGKPTIRKTSQLSDINRKENLNRRTYSLKDKASIMTTSIYFTEDEIKGKNLIFSSDKEDTIPQKEITEMGDNSSTKDQIHMTNTSSTDSLDNFKSSTYSRSNEMESDSISKDRTEVDDDVTLMSNTESYPKKQETNSIIKQTYNKSMTPPGSNSGTPKGKDKAEKPIIERKPHDPKMIIDEMRRYYENEIYVLKKQLQQVGSNILPNEEALQKRCHLLESQLRKSQNDAESLNEQVIGLKSQLQTWPNRVTELEDNNETLRGRIEDVRAINQQRQNEIDELHEIVKNLETKLWENSTGTQQQEKIFLQRLMQEYDHLLKDYDLLKLNHITNERKLYESRSIQSEMSTKISDLEKQIQKLENENNFLKRRLNSEKSFATSSYRGWARCAYPPQMAGFEPDVSPRNGSSQELLSYNQSESQPAFDLGMMSMSCYGALPSYSNTNDTREQRSENMRRFEALKTKINERYSHGQMNQSMYAQPPDENQEVITPTGERRRVAIKDDSQYPSKQFKVESLPFDMQNDVSESVANQQMTTSISDFRQGDVSHGFGRRKKPEYYNRDSWANSRTDEDVELERRYDVLQNEKKQLLTQLSHIPSNSSSRNRRSNREQREGLETQLDQIDRQLGLMRMTLKQKNILK